jgi:hypothetical protein
MAGDSNLDRRHEFERRQIENRIDLICELDDLFTNGVEAVPETMSFAMQKLMIAQIEDQERQLQRSVGLNESDLKWFSERARLFKDEGEHRNDVEWFSRGVGRRSLARAQRDLVRRNHRRHDPRMGGES